MTHFKKHSPQPVNITILARYVLICIVLIFSINAISQSVCNLGFPNTWVNTTINQTATYANVNIEIAGTVTITNGAVLTISSCQLYMASDAKIIIEHNASLFLDGNTFEACGSQLWDGIYININSNLYAHDNNIFDAINAFYSIDGGYYEVESNTFDKCENALTVKQYNGDHQGQFYNNSMNLTQTPLPGGNGLTSPAILVEDILANTPGHTLTIGLLGATNSFSGFHGSNIIVENSDIEIIDAIVNLDASLEAISFIGGTSANDLRLLNVDHVVTYNTANNTANHSLFASNYFNANITNNTFSSNSLYTHSVLYNSFGEIYFFNNKLNNSQNTGLQINGNTGATTVSYNTISFDYGRGALFSNTGTFNTLIYNNEFYFTGPISVPVAIHIENSSAYNIYDNTIRLNEYGKCIAATNSNGILIDNNSISQYNNSSQTYFPYSRNIEINNCYGVEITENTLKLPSPGYIIGYNIYTYNNCYNISINNNTMDYGYYGVKIDNCHDVIANSNIINNPKWGIFTTYTTTIEIYNNNITFQTGSGAIRCYYGASHDIQNNGIISTNTSNKTGIGIYHSNNNIVNNNTIDLLGYSSSYPQGVAGITIENCGNTDVQENNITNCGFAMRFNQNNNGGKIKCNDMSYSYYGIYLNNTLVGEYNNNNFEIGHNGEPYDNSWSNIAIINARVKGSIAQAPHDFYFNNSAPEFSLNSSQYDVPLVPPFPFTSYSTTGQQGGQCGGGQQQKIIGDSPLISQSTTVKDNYRQAQIGFAINNLPNSNSISISNPQGIYNSILRYNVVRNAYFRLMDKNYLLNLGIASDAKYNAFDFSIGSSNIGVEYNIDKNIRLANYNNAIQYLQNYSPNNLAEIYTYESTPKSNLTL